MVEIKIKRLELHEPVEPVIPVEPVEPVENVEWKENEKFVYMGVLSF